MPEVRRDANGNELTALTDPENLKLVWVDEPEEDTGGMTDDEAEQFMNQPIRALGEGKQQ